MCNVSIIQRTRLFSIDEFYFIKFGNPTNTCQTRERKNEKNGQILFTNWERKKKRNQIRIGIQYHLPNHSTFYTFLHTRLGVVSVRAYVDEKWATNCWHCLPPPPPPWATSKLVFDCQSNWNIPFNCSDIYCSIIHIATETAEICTKHCFNTFH